MLFPALPTMLLLVAPGAAQDLSANVPSPAAAAETETQMESPPMMLRLRDGRVLWGAIDEHDPETVWFRRVDTGGRVHLPWSFLDPGQEYDLRLSYGYVDDTGEEIYVTADRLVLSGNEEIVGLITHYSDDFIYVKTATSVVPVPKLRVAGPSTRVQVPALDVYTREELYKQKLDELGDALLEESPAAAPLHHELAKFCETILDYAHAVEHYRQAARLDPTYEAQELAVALPRAERKALAQEQVDYLAECERLRKRKRYDEALVLCEAFRQLYPESPLFEDYNRTLKRIQKSQLEAVRQEIVAQWHSQSARLALAAARTMEFDDAVAYADSQLREDLLKAVHERTKDIAKDIAPEVVQSLWAERERGRMRTASYGLATWLLGADRARKLLQEEEDEAAKDAEQVLERSSQAEQRKQIEEKLKRYFENQERARRSQSSQSMGADPAEHWKTMRTEDKRRWIHAYYVEFSGDMHLREVRFQNCPTCAGTGVLSVINLGNAGNEGEGGADAVSNPCTTCQTVGVIRRLRYW